MRDITGRSSPLVDVKSQPIPNVALSPRDVHLIATVNNAPTRLTTDFANVELRMRCSLQ